MNKSTNDILVEKFHYQLRSKRTVSLYAYAKKNNLEYADVISLLKELQNWGYNFKLTKESATLLTTPDRLIDLEIAYDLKTKFIGKKIITYQKLKSTNDIANTLAEAGEPEGTIVISEEQTKGRGRLGRMWYSPAGRGIYLSIILKPSFAPESAPGISIMTALALADTINKYLPGIPKIKWPNDILLKNKKTSGILTELSSEKDKINHIIVGVGININNTSGEFPDDLKPISTSLRRVKGSKINRIEFLQKFLVNFEKEYLSYKKNLLKPKNRKIKKYSSLIGTRVKLSYNRQIIEGDVLDIDFRGALIVEIDGRPTPVTSGEVTIVKR